MGSLFVRRVTFQIVIPVGMSLGVAEHHIHHTHKLTRMFCPCNSSISILFSNDQRQGVLPVTVRVQRSCNPLRPRQVSAAIMDAVRTIKVCFQHAEAVRARACTHSRIARSPYSEVGSTELAGLQTDSRHLWPSFALLCAWWHTRPAARTIPAVPQRFQSCLWLIKMLLLRSRCSADNF